VTDLCSNWSASPFKTSTIVVVEGCSAEIRPFLKLILASVLDSCKVFSAFNLLFKKGFSNLKIESYDKLNFFC